MFATGKDSVITLDQLPSGRYQAPVRCVNGWQHCFTSLCIKLLREIGLQPIQSFYYTYFFLFSSRIIFLSTEHEQNINFVMKSDTNTYIHACTHCTHTSTRLPCLNYFFSVSVIFFLPPTSSFSSLQFIIINSPSYELPSHWLQSAASARVNGVCELLISVGHRPAALNGAQWDYRGS